MNRALGILIVSLSLMGCANPKFDCPYQDGVHCKSLSEVEREIDAGLNSNSQNSKKTALKPLTPISVPASPLRTPEEVLSVWIAPYQTQDGSYFEEKIMHFVVRDAEWIAASEIEGPAL